MNLTHRNRHRRRSARRLLAPVLTLAAIGAADPRPLQADPPAIAWVATLDGGGQPFATDVVNDLAINAAGELCVTGFSATTGGASGAMTVLYEPDGTERWRRLYVAPETAGNEEGTRAFLDPDGRCFVAGRRSSATTGPDVLVLAYDAEGTLSWSASHDGPDGGFDVGVDVAADAAGNVFVLALVAGGASDWDITTLKYGADGQSLWARTFDGPAGAEDQPAGLAVDIDGNAYVTGTARVALPFDDDVVVVKYDPDGGDLWTRFLDGGAGGSDRSGGLAISVTGDPYVAGRFRQPGGEWQAAVHKLHADGSDDWDASTGHPAVGIPEEVRGLVLGDDGSAYVAFTGSDDVLVTRFDSQGETDWSHLEDGVSLGSGASRPLAVDAAGNAYVAAWDFVAFDGIQFLTYRMEAGDGSVAWRTTFGEPGEESEDIPRALSVDSLGDLVVAGTIQADGATFENDWAVVKYRQEQLFADGFESGDASRWSSVAEL